MAIVCLDTQVVFWGILGHRAKHVDERLVRHTAGFIKLLKEENHDVIIPSIVVGEMLVAIPDEEKTDVLTKFDSQWIVADYDLRAAYQFAIMRRDHITKKRFKELRHLNPDVTRKELVADLMIVATAIAHNAATIYSHDKPLLALAEDWIDAVDFSGIPIQQELLGNEQDQSE